MPTSIFLLLLFLLRGAAGDVESDRRECGDALMGLATCLTYVGGNSKSPTPDCCAGLKQMLSSSPKCLCLLIKDHDNPAVDLKMDPVAPCPCRPSAALRPTSLTAQSSCTYHQILQTRRFSRNSRNKSHGNGSASGSIAGLSSSNLVASYAGRSAFYCAGRWWWWMGMEAVVCLVASLPMLLLGR